MVTLGITHPSCPKNHGLGSSCLRNNVFPKANGWFSRNLDPFAPKKLMVLLELEPICLRQPCFPKKLGHAYLGKHMVLQELGQFFPSNTWSPKKLSQFATRNHVSLGNLGQQFPKKMIVLPSKTKGVDERCRW